MTEIVTPLPQGTINLAATGSSTAATAIPGTWEQGPYLRVVAARAGGLGYLRIGNASMGPADTSSSMLTQATVIHFALAQTDTHVRYLSADVPLSVTRCSIRGVAC